MRKTFVILGSLAIALLAFVDDGYAQLRRGGCSGGSSNGYVGGRVNYGPEVSYGSAWMGTDSRPSFYHDPALQGAARFTVLLPIDDAQIWFDGAVTQQRGRERVFVTPALERDGTYTIKARWMVDGKPIEQERRIQVRGGQAHMVDFRAAPPKKMPTPGDTPKTDQVPLPKSDPSKKNNELPLPKSDPSKKNNELPLPKSDPSKKNDELPLPNSDPSKKKDLPVSVPNAEQPIGKGDQMPLIKIDGEWTAIYAEMDGKKIEDKGFSNVIIKGNMITCRHDAKEKTFRLDFGPHHMVRCTEQTGADLTLPTEKRGAHTHHGVYVASQDYLCLSLNKGVDRRAVEASGIQKDIPRDNQPRTPDRFDGQGPHGAAMVLILRRAGTGAAGRE